MPFHLLRIPPRDDVDDVWDLVRDRPLRPYEGAYLGSYGYSILRRLRSSLDKYLLPRDDDDDELLG